MSRPIKEHELKSWPEFFGPVVSGEKTFELRADDRDFQVGDILRLREWEPRDGSYTGREIRKQITYKLIGVGMVGAIAPLRGLSRPYVILSIRDPDA